MILYLIPARGGSKRLPGKNLRKLAGIPLVAWAIRRAQGAARIVGGESRIVVSTDSEEIASVAREWGAEVLMRPGRLAMDKSTTTAVARHAAREYSGAEGDLLVLVQPTSPLATAADVADGVRTARSHGTCVRSTLAGRPNGAVYVTNAGMPMLESHGDCCQTFEMPKVRSIDIDTEDDWFMAEALLAARKPAPFAIGERQIGPGHPCFIIAEAGINHGGDVTKAHELVDAAADSGADAVKFQAFVPENLAEPGAHRIFLESHQLEWADFRALKVHAERRGLVFLSSVFDVVSAECIDDLGMTAHKIPSGEIINLPLLRHVASKGKPVILSTGMSTMVEIARAVDALAGVPLALLHCVSEYPTLREKDVNLSAMDTLRQAFGLPVGWSDHGCTTEFAEIAAARGASIIEKHLALDVDALDKSVSALPREFASMETSIRFAEASIGTGEKVPTSGELETAKTARRRDGLRRNA